MGSDSQSSGNKFVTEDHCGQATLRIEGKLDALITKLEPKLDMIVRIDTSLKWVKGIALLLCSGGFLTVVYKVYSYFESLPKK